MPIKNLTDNVIPQFPQIGKLRKGGEKTPKGFGPELDHWRFTSERPEVEKAFYDFYKSEPRTIQVYLPYATPEEAFDTWCEVWNASSLVHRCDGENMTIWLEGDTYKRGSKPCDNGQHKDGDPLNDAIGRLSVIIPVLWEVGYIGYVTMETHSKNDIINISRALEATYQARQSNELGLRGILFSLRRVPEKISVPGFGQNAGKRSKVQKYLVKIEPAADWVMMQLEGARNMQMLSDGTETKLLAEPSPEPQPQPEQTAVEGEVVDDEPEMDEEFERLGNLLWPGLWETSMREQVMSSTRFPTNEQKLNELRSRYKGVNSGIERLKKHIGLKWEGYERLVPPLHVAAGNAWDPIAAIAGIAYAAEQHAAQPGLDDEMLVSMALSQMPKKDDAPPWEG